MPKVCTREFFSNFTTSFKYVHSRDQKLKTKSAAVKNSKMNEDNEDLLVKGDIKDGSVYRSSRLEGVRPKR